MPNNTLEKWDEKTLGELCDVLDSRRKPITKKDRVAGVYPYYGATGILDYVSGWIFDEELVLLGEDGAKWTSGEQSAFKINGKTWVNNHAHVLRPKRDRISDTYLIYNLNFQNLMPYITGTTVPKLNQEKMRSITIPLPPLPEQERIVAKLDKAFEAIDKVKANAEQNFNNTKELFESYLNNIFSNINASFNKKLSDVTKIVGGGTPSKSTPTYYQGNIPWATVRDMNEDDLSKTEFSITNEAVRSSATNIIPANNVIIATRVGLGKVCILMQDTAINQDLKGIIPTKPMNFKYLFWWFKSIKNKIEEAGVGATVKGVKLPFVQNLQIPYISINDQQKIVEKLDALQEQTKQLEQIYTQKIKKCDELKQSILQKAFRGEL